MREGARFLIEQPQDALRQHMGLAEPALADTQAKAPGSEARLCRSSVCCGMSARAFMRPRPSRGRLSPTSFARARQMVVIVIFRGELREWTRRIKARRVAELIEQVFQIGEMAGGRSLFEQIRPSTPIHRRRRPSRRQGPGKRPS